MLREQAGAEPIPSRRLAVAASALGTLAVNINSTGLNLALPEIREELGLTAPELQWLAAIYALVLAALTMLGGALGDRFDTRSVLSVGLSVYVVGCLLAVFAGSGPVLIASRALAAAGASVLVPLGLAQLRALADSREQLAWYMAVWGLAIGVGMAAGPVAGGVLTQLAGWRSFFLALAVLGVVHLVLVRTAISDCRSGAGTRIDPISNLLLASSMFAFTALIINVDSGTPFPVKVALAIAAPALAALWCWRERSRAASGPLTVLRDRVFSVSMLIAFFNYAGLGGTLLITALLLQDLLLLEAGQAGLASIPLAVANGLGARVLGRLRAASGIRLAGAFIVIGTLVAAFAVWLTLQELPLAVVLAVFAAGTACMGFGYGAANTPVNYLAMSSVPTAAAGAAGAFASSSRQLGQSTGVAVCGALLAWATAASVPLASVEPGIRVYAPATLAVLLAGVCVLLLPGLYRTRPSSAG